MDMKIFYRKRRCKDIAKPKDITGKRFGKLIAICIDEAKTKQSKVRCKIWKCQCDCGNITYVSIGNLNSGNVVSCGCYKEDLKQARFQDLTGLKFNKLTVLNLGKPYSEKCNRTKNGYLLRRTWDCLCDCGNIKYGVLEKQLKNGSVKSCGCLSKEQSRINGKQTKKYNKYDLSKEYGIGFGSNNKEFYFDIEDYEKIKNINWIVKSNNYVEGMDEERNPISLHRLIMGFPNCHVDHINHQTNDNRKINLRLVNRSQNQANTKLRIDNTSGTKGVYFNRLRGCWIGCIQVNHNKFSKGFANKEDAIKYRKYLEDKYQKEYSYENSMYNNGRKKKNDFISW